MFFLYITQWPSPTASSKKKKKSFLPVTKEFICKTLVGVFIKFCLQNQKKKKCLCQLEESFYNASYKLVCPTQKGWNQLWFCFDVMNCIHIFINGVAINPSKCFTQEHRTRICKVLPHILLGYEKNATRCYI